MARLTIERPDGVEVVECRSVAEWLEAEQWPKLHIYDGDRRLTADDASLLLEPMADLRAVDVPGVSVPIALVAITVLSAGYSFYLASSLAPPALGDQNRNAGSTNNSLGERQNQPVKVGQRIPEIWGGVPRAYPLLLSQWRLFDDGGNEFDAAYMLLGRGAYHLSAGQFREGDQLVERISGSNLTVWGPNKSPWRSDFSDRIPQLQIVNDNNPAVLGRIPQIVSEISGVDGQTLTPTNQVTTSKLLLITSDGWIDLEDAPTGETLADIYGIGDTITLTDCFAWEFISKPYGLPYHGNYAYFLRHSLEGSYTVVDNDGQRVQVTPGAQPGWAHIPVGGQYQASQAVVGHLRGPGGPNYGITGYKPTFPAGSYGSTTAIVVQRTEFYSPINAVLGRLLVGQFSIPDWADEIVINFAAPNGIYKLPSSGGDAVGGSVSVTATVNYPDNTTSATSGWVDYNSTDVRTATGESITVALDPQTDRTVTLSRGDTDRVFSGTVVDEVKVREIYAVKHLPADWNPGDVTTISMIQSVTQSALKAKERKLSVPAIRKVTANPSDDLLFSVVLPAMHVDQFNGRRSAGSIDEVTLDLIEDQVIAAGAAGDYPTTRALFCGYTFDEKNQTYEDQLKLLCNAVNLQPYSIGGDISFLWRWKRDVSVLITHRDIMPGTFTRNRQLTPSREFSGVELTYTDSANGENITLSLDADGRQREINLAGQNYAEMATLAMHTERNRQKYVRQICEFEVGLIGLRLAVGMRVLIDDCTRRTNATGEVLAIAGQVITTSQPVPTGISSVWLSKRDGSAYQVAATKTGANEITIGTGIVLPEAPYTDWQERKTRYAAWGPSVDLPPLDMEITEISPVSATQVRIKAQTYDGRVYQWPI